MSSNSINFGLLNIDEKCNNFLQAAPSNTDDLLQYTSCTQKQDADAEYFDRVKIVLTSHMHSINFVNPGNIRKLHKALMSQIRKEVINISNKCKIQIEPIQLERDRFISTLEKDFPEILNEVLSHNDNQQQLPNSNEHKSTLNEDRNQCNAGTNNRTRTLSLSTTHPNKAHMFHHISHSIPDTTNM